MPLSPVSLTCSCLPPSHHDTRATSPSHCRYCARVATHRSFSHVSLIARLSRRETTEFSCLHPSFIRALSIASSSPPHQTAPKPSSSSPVTHRGPIFPCPGRWTASSRVTTPVISSCHHRAPSTAPASFASCAPLFLLSATQTLGMPRTSAAQASTSCNVVASYLPFWLLW